MFKFLLVLQVILNAFFLWRIVSLDNYRLKLNLLLKKFDEKLTKLFRMKHKADTSYGEQICSSCGELLPENTLKTHEGKLLCSVCKVSGVAI